MPIMILSLFAKIGIPERFRAFAAWGVAALVLGLCIWLLVTGFNSWLSQERSDAVTLNQAEVSAAVSEQTLAADRSASANAIIADDLARNNAKELDDAVSEPNNNSTRVVSVLERMRQQQRDGKR